MKHVWKVFLCELAYKSVEQLSKGLYTVCECFLFTNGGRSSRRMCSICIDMHIPCSNPSTGHFVDSERMSSNCHKIEQSVWKTLANLQSYPKCTSGNRHFRHVRGQNSECKQCLF